MQRCNVERAVPGMGGDGCHSNRVPPPLLRAPPCDLAVVGREQVHQEAEEPQLHRQQRAVGLPLASALQCRAGQCFVCI